MNRLLLALTLLLGAIPIATAEPDVSLQFPKSQLQDVLSFYAHAGHRKVWVALGVGGVVDLRSEAQLPLPDALALIRNVLLQKHGIEVRDTPTGETFVSWSTDPKLKPLQEATIRNAKQLPSPSLEDKRRVRVINK